MVRGALLFVLVACVVALSYGVVHGENIFLENWCRSEGFNWDGSKCEIPLNATATVASADALIISQGQTLENNAVLENNGGIYNFGAMINTWRFWNNGFFHIYGTFTDKYAANTFNNGHIYISSNGTINQDGEKFFNEKESTINNKGTINIKGYNFSNVGTLNNYGTINNNGKLGNSLNMYNKPGGTLNNIGTLTNNHYFENWHNLFNYGDFVNESAGNIANRGAWRMAGRTTNSGTLWNWSDGIIYRMLCMDGVFSGNTILNDGVIYDLDECAYTPMLAN